MSCRMNGILVLTVMLISGCVQPKTLEENGIMNIYGVDIAGDDQLKTTAVFYKFGAPGQDPSSLVTGQGKTLSKGQKRMNYKLGFQLQSGAIELELFGKKAAENGLIDYLRAASRHPRASNNRLLAVSDTTAKNLITKLDGLPNINVNQALPNIIDVNSHMNVIPEVTLHNFQKLYYEPGIDPVMPILSYQNERTRLTALALFKGDQLAGQIPVDQAFYINVLHQNIRGLQQEVQLPLQPLKKYLLKEPKSDQTDFYTLFNIKKGEGNIKLVNKQNLHFHTQLNFEVNILELTESVGLQKPAAINAFEQEIEKAIKEQYEQLLSKLQKWNVDPMGYGRTYKTQKRNSPLTESEWRDKFPDVTFDVDVNVDILDQGMTP
ncbi:hypothetical protein GCM10007063_33440 [Lentibacillus kapialis]|uniref:Ger(X)C family spore germination protein n=1 Tax=Lentibacillus kapialis TaxID=340214 RepID=A0A917V1C7_9BACI|nr:Ger(x)C family spore germination protein [Lentibacillus kapialis]GGK08349.1 hypothetical protein GCM10007063_33440 [Lentibacillus kapialis]